MKEKIYSKRENLECDKCNYPWDLIIDNSKRKRPNNNDPTAAAMNEFIGKINKNVKSKRDINQLDAKLNSLSDTPQKSNHTF